MPRSKKPRHYSGRPLKHGSRTFAKAHRENQIDQRTTVAKHLQSIKNGLVDDAGGPDHVSVAREILIDRVGPLVVLASTFEAHLIRSAAKPPDAPATPDTDDPSSEARENYLEVVGVLGRLLGKVGLGKIVTEKAIDLREYLVEGAARRSAAEAQAAVGTDDPAAQNGGAR